MRLKNTIFLALLILVAFTFSACGGDSGGNGGGGGNGDGTKYTSDQINQKITSFKVVSSSTDEAQQQIDNTSSGAPSGGSGAGGKSIFSNRADSGKGDGSDSPALIWSGPDSEGWYSSSSTEKGASTLKFKPTDANGFEYKEHTEITSPSETDDLYAKITLGADGKWSGSMTVNYEVHLPECSLKGDMTTTFSNVSADKKTGTFSGTNSMTFTPKNGTSQTDKYDYGYTVDEVNGSSVMKWTTFKKDGVDQGLPTNKSL